jgi:hypothetical protein
VEYSAEAGHDPINLTQQESGCQGVVKHFLACSRRRGPDECDLPGS